jgi:hypothetical protein
VLDGVALLPERLDEKIDIYHAEEFTADGLSSARVRWDKQKRQLQRETQIPFGNDNKKAKATAGSFQMTTKEATAKATADSLRE